jgi:hypothetical protein
MAASNVFVSYAALAVNIAVLEMCSSGLSHSE